jgi:hypothetical protein
MAWHFTLIYKQTFSWKLYAWRQKNISQNGEVWYSHPLRDLSFSRYPVFLNPLHYTPKKKKKKNCHIFSLMRGWVDPRFLLDTVTKKESLIQPRKYKRLHFTSQWPSNNTVR